MPHVLLCRQGLPSSAFARVLPGSDGGLRRRLRQPAGSVQRQGGTLAGGDGVSPSSLLASCTRTNPNPNMTLTTQGASAALALFFLALCIHHAVRRTPLSCWRLGLSLVGVFWEPVHMTPYTNPALAYATPFIGA